MYFVGICYFGYEYFVGPSTLLAVLLCIMVTDLYYIEPIKKELKELKELNK